MDGRGNADRKRSKKKTARNPYWFFVEEFRKEHHLNLNWEQVSILASPHWQELPQAGREKYNIMSKTYKAELSDTERFTSIGVSCLEIERDKEAQKAALEREQEYVTKEIEHGLKSGIEKKEFFVMHTNYYCVTNNNSKYHTCEVGMAKFTLGKGVESELHSLIPRPIPLGYIFDAQMNANLHGVEVVEFPEKADFVKLFVEVGHFLGSCTTRQPEDTYEFPPIYTLPENIKAVTSFLNEICAAAGYSIQFRVYALDKLFFRLYLAIATDNVGYPSLTLCYDILVKDEFIYYKDLGCAMHEKGEKYTYCSLAVAKRYCYSICNHCCKQIKVTPIPGKHIPTYDDQPTSSAVTNVPIASSNPPPITDPKPSRNPQVPSNSNGHSSQTDDDSFTPVVPRGRRGRGRAIIR